MGAPETESSVAPGSWGCGCTPSKRGTGRRASGGRRISCRPSGSLRLRMSGALWSLMTPLRLLRRDSARNNNTVIVDLCSANLFNYKLTTLDGVQD